MNKIYKLVWSKAKHMYIAVAEIGNREINHAVSSKEGKCADGTILLKSCHFLVSG